jgi:small subunit ribosomal protein S17
MPQRVAVGIVTSDKTPKTRRVEIPRLVRHPRYGKYLRRKTVCTVHDENNESHTGDMVEITESRPMSRTKRWMLVRVVEKGRVLDLVAMRAAARADRTEQETI